MKKIILFSLVLFSIILNKNNLYSEDIIIYPLKKPILKPEVKEKKISINIIKPLKKPIIKKVEKKPKEEKIKEKKVTKLGIIVPKSKPKIIQKTIKKTAKKSKYYSKKKFSLAKRSIESFEKGKWTQAIQLAKKSKDRSIYNFVQWRHLITRGNKASFYDYQQFIVNNPDYPRIGRIKYLSEHKMSTKTISPKKIIEWFENSPPLSGYGEIVLGESLIATGQISKGTNLIKKGWITAELSKSDLRFFRKKYKKYLNKKDYINRAEYLAWENKYWDLRRLLRYLPKEEQLLYTARQLLMSKSYGVDNAISKVPYKYKNDPGLDYDRLKWRRKRGRLESSLEILLKVKNTKEYLVRPEKWWNERRIIARSLIYKKRYEQAYKITSKHAMTEGQKKPKQFK